MDSARNRNNLLLDLPAGHAWQNALSIEDRRRPHWRSSQPRPVRRPLSYVLCLYASCWARIPLGRLGQKKTGLARQSSQNRCHSLESLACLTSFNPPFASQTSSIPIFKKLWPPQSASDRLSPPWSAWPSARRTSP